MLDQDDALELVPLYRLVGEASYKILREWVQIQYSDVEWGLSAEVCKYLGINERLEPEQLQERQTPLSGLITSIELQGGQNIGTTLSESFSDFYSLLCHFEDCKQDYANANEDNWLPMVQAGQKVEILEVVSQDAFPTLSDMATAAAGFHRQLGEVLRAKVVGFQIVALDGWKIQPTVDAPQQLHWTDEAIQQIYEWIANSRAKKEVLEHWLKVNESNGYDIHHWMESWAETIAEIDLNTPVSEWKWSRFRRGDLQRKFIESLDWNSPEVKRCIDSLDQAEAEAERCFQEVVRRQTTQTRSDFADSLTKLSNAISNLLEDRTDNPRIPPIIAATPIELSDIELQVLDAYPKDRRGFLTNDQLNANAKNPVGKNSIGDIVNKLIDAGYAERPEGKTRTSQISDAGLKYLEIA